MKQIFTGYKKGDRILVHAGLNKDGSLHLRPAEVISMMKIMHGINDTPYVTLHYLDMDGAKAYECVSIDRIAGLYEEQ